MAKLVYVGFPSPLTKVKYTIFIIYLSHLIPYSLHILSDLILIITSTLEISGGMLQHGNLGGSQGQPGVTRYLPGEPYLGLL